MTEIEAETPHSNGYADIKNDEDDERGKMRPADIDAVRYKNRFPESIDNIY